MIRSILSVTGVIILLLVSCNFPTTEPSATATGEVDPAPATDLASTEGGDPVLPEEAIQILGPGPGSRLTSPLQVTGIADPTFEQNLVVRLVLDDGQEIALQPTTIQAELGARGPFEAEVAFSVRQERAALLQVYSTSARDGGIVHLSSMSVRLLPEGEQEIVPAEPHPEDIVIYSPALGEVVSGGVLHVEGFGLASFEGTLVVYIYDADGNEIASMPLIVEAPDMGLPGTFEIDIPYTVAGEGPARVVVVDPLPVFDGVGHISSIEITLAP